jgi:hypothetical protein
MKKLLLALIAILGLTSCSSSGFENTFTDSKCYAHVQMKENTATHFELLESSITPSGVVKGVAEGNIPIILSPGTYVLFKSTYCMVCEKYVD